MQHEMHSSVTCGFCQENQSTVRRPHHTEEV